MFLTGFCLSYMSALELRKNTRFGLVCLSPWAKHLWGRDLTAGKNCCQIIGELNQLSHCQVCYL